MGLAVRILVVYKDSLVHGVFVDPDKHYTFCLDGNPESKF
jgi:hypothetical protein